MIEIEKLTVSRGEKLVINELTTTIDTATIAVIIGPNGCGKSTLLSCIAGEIKADSGCIRINRRDVAELSLKEASQIRTVLSQLSNHWLAYTVRQSLELGQSKEAIARIDSMMVKLDIADIRDQSILTLSGGQAQRVEIARALISDREVLLLDEPLAAQDLRGCQKVIEVLTQLKAEGKTILLVAHAQSGDLTWCDQIIDNLA